MDADTFIQQTFEELFYMKQSLIYTTGNYSLNILVIFLTLIYYTVHLLIHMCTIYRP